MKQRLKPVLSGRFFAKLTSSARKVLCSLIVTALLAQPSLATRNVQVQVDGELLDTRAYVEEGVTYVPLRHLLDSFDGWHIEWDSQSQAAVAVSDSVQLIADPEEHTITLNDTDYSARVTVENGRTYIPLRLVVEALGGSVKWDPYLDGAAVTSPDAKYDAADLYWLSHIIHSESGGESLNGQIAVGNVVLNRVRSSEFPDTIPGVIFDRVDGIQFEPVANGTIYKRPTELSMMAAKQVLDGVDAIGDAMYFYAPALSQGIWINANRTYHKTIGCHRFYL